MATPLSDEDFLKRFDAAEWPAAEWHHREHIKVAYLHLRQYQFDEALRRLRAGIRKLNASHGTPETPARSYHEAITVAWLRLVEFTLAVHGPADSADAFFEQHAELSQPKILRLYYSRDRITSIEAKTQYLPPDFASFPTSP